jgi:hypothetical protein
MNQLGLLDDKSVGSPNIFLAFYITFMIWPLEELPEI